MGLLLHARSVVGDRVVGGKFTLYPPGTHTVSCLSAADTVTHSDKLLKRNLSFTWRAPAQPSGDLRFYITIVHSYFVYWTRIHSAVVHDGTHKTQTGHNGGIHNGIVSASPTEPVNAQTHTHPHTHSEYPNSTHTQTSNFPTHTVLPQYLKHTHTPQQTSTRDLGNTTHTQLYTTAHTQPSLHTHTRSGPSNDMTHTQTHTETTPVMHTHTSPKSMQMARSRSTHTPSVHTRSPTADCTSRDVAMVTLKMHTHLGQLSTPPSSQHTHSSNTLTHTPSHTPTTSHKPTHTPKHTPTASHTPSHTPTTSHKPIHTPTASHAQTHTPSHTPTGSHTSTHTPTASHTQTHTPTASHTTSHTPTASHTPIGPHMKTPSPATSHTRTSTHTPIASHKPSHTPTALNMPTHTPVISHTLIHTSTHTPTASHTPIHTFEHTPPPSHTPTHTLSASLPRSPSSSLHPGPSAALQRFLSDLPEPRDDPQVVFVKPHDPEPNPEAGIKTGGGVKPESGAGLVSQPVLLLVLSLALLVALAVYIQRKHCVRRSGVSLSTRGQERAGVRRVEDCGELVQLRRVRENSLLLLQAQYDIITAPGN